MVDVRNDSVLIMNKIYIVLFIKLVAFTSCDGALFSSGYCEGLHITPNEFWGVNAKKNLSLESDISTKDIEITMEDTEKPISE